MNNNTNTANRPRRPMTFQDAHRGTETFKYVPRRTLGVQNALWGALGFILLVVVVSVASVWALRVQMTPPADRICSEYVGPTATLDYENGVWSRSGNVIGYSLYEDSPIMSTASCAGL